ncbi:MAG: hypothetical protein ILP07_11540 [Treponema sp.]|nr:hypothetical protein [Treponema sp.]
MEDTVTPPVQHIGEFVLTKNGSLDFGEIPSEIARVIKRQEGKIRLRIGVESDNAIGKKNAPLEMPKRAALTDRNGRRPFFAQVRSPFKRILLDYLIKI